MATKFCLANDFIERASPEACMAAVLLSFYKSNIKENEISFDLFDLLEQVVPMPLLTMKQVDKFFELISAGIDDLVQDGDIILTSSDDELYRGILSSELIGPAVEGKYVCEDIDLISKIFVETSLRTIAKRIKIFLLILARRKSPYFKTGYYAVDRKKLGEELGVNPQTISKHLEFFVEMNLLSVIRDYRVTENGNTIRAFSIYCLPTHKTNVLAHLRMTNEDHVYRG